MGSTTLYFVSSVSCLDVREECDLASEDDIR
jgi:hypothetical protein